MAKPNYQFQKRQKELQRKKIMEEKRQRKLAKSNPPDVNPDRSEAPDKTE